MKNLGTVQIKTYSIVEMSKDKYSVSVRDVQMVLPLVDEHKPKCYLCHQGFENIEKLREHQKIAHKDFFEHHEKGQRREPAPGDVSIF